jgi:polyhydroxyalkanoate synthase
LALERAASGWLGHIAADVPELEARWSALDQTARAAVARVTGGISPVSVAAAYADWALHLALAPGKQMQLAEKTLKKSLRWGLYAYSTLRPGGQEPAVDEPGIDPLPQDKRFADPAWQAWPYNWMVQGFLLTQQWWHVATTGVPGMTQHHEDMVNFGTRQWLDRVAPSNFVATNPVVGEAIQREFGANLWRGWQNAVEDWQRQLSGRPPAGVEAFQVGRDLATTPGKVVLRNRLMELIQYTPTTEKVHPEPLLIIPAWIMKYYILDLSPHNSMISYLVGQGHTVFTISWKNPDPTIDAADRELGMDDYRRLGVMDALDAIGTICPKQRVHGVGYCLGGTLAAIAAAQMARDGDQRLASLTLLAAQVDFEEPGEISLFIDDSQVTFLEDSMRQSGVLEGQQMAGAFRMLRSNDLIWSYQLQNYLLGQRQPVNDLMAWNADVTRMPFRMHSEYLRQLFLDNALAEGRFLIGARPVALTDIRVPLFAVGTVTDHVAPWRSVYKIHRLTDTDVTFTLTSGGHNAGIVSEPGHAHRRYQQLDSTSDACAVDPERWLKSAPAFDGSWWPSWQRWLAARSGARRSPPPMGSRAAPVLCDAPGEYVHGR